ncbi:phage baseplate assembly protein [Neptunomonas antarctica]|uniref:Mu-like prophage tail protein gpP n=1 Tax=Neptunomonas antarctica TaxID=619304 RepID=A0A1N7MPD9_9GAMM|nr:hypothetical protein [Neptunomonas antarctica]SIS87801.1 Mu-like prophage tail protein gpP [Neptunomonas antarctica]
MSDQLILMMDGKPHRGWTRATVGRSIERGPQQFDVSLTDTWGNTEGINPRSVQIGMGLQVYVNDDLLLTGYIDDVDPEYGATTHALSARGRSKLGDLVDCSTEGKQFSGQSLAQIATLLCKPFGISVLIDASAKTAANQPFVGKTPTLDLGQPIWEFLEEQARIRAVLLISDEQGNLRITRAGTARADVALALGKNIKSASGSFSAQALFSDYIVTGQQPNTPQVKLEGVDNSQPKAAISSSATVARHRPFVVSSDNPLDIAGCKTRAEWQRNVHEGRSVGVVYTVSGWRQTSGGRIWTPNELIQVTDPWMGWNDQRLIVETRLMLDDDGSNTEIRVMPKEAFALVPEVETVSRGFIL